MKNRKYTHFVILPEGQKFLATSLKDTKKQKGEWEKPAYKIDWSKLKDTLTEKQLKKVGKKVSTLKDVRINKIIYPEDLKKKY